MSSLEPTTATDADAGDSSLDPIRAVQREWAKVPVERRLESVTILRNLIVERSRELAESISRLRKVSQAEALTTEVIPMADALEFLEKNAVDLLKSRTLGAQGRPKWLKGVTSEVRQEPHGIVLVIAPSNYPFFLAAAQGIQALVAGNAVVVKPAPDCSSVMELWDSLITEAQVPEGLHHVLLENPQNALDAIAAGIDKVVLTGGPGAGNAILHACADAVTPATVELSGIDAMYVRHDADLKQVIRALKFGLSVNRGHTCIAPRRIFVHHQRANELREKLAELPICPEPTKVTEVTASLLSSTLDSGATTLCGEWSEANGTLRYPLILDGVPFTSPFWAQDFFSPIAVLCAVAGDAEALEIDRACPYALGASVFSNDLKGAKDLAENIPAGVVTINDVIAPTGDPRLPFGGRKRSGFGATRGPEGLLEMTTPKVVSTRRMGTWAPHLTETIDDSTSELFHYLLQFSHGQGMMNRFKALMQVIKLSREAKQQPTKEPDSKSKPD